MSSNDSDDWFPGYEYMKWIKWIAAYCDLEKENTAFKNYLLKMQLLMTKKKRSNYLTRISSLRLYFFYVLDQI